LLPAIRDHQRAAPKSTPKETPVKKFIIERNVPGIGQQPAAAFCDIAKKSQGVLDEIGQGVQWQESFVTAAGTYCVYLATSEELVREHARRSGFPADRIVEVVRVIDPSTAAG
jgi:hypothetical protein